MLAQFLSQSNYHNNYLLNNKKTLLKIHPLFYPCTSLNSPHIKKRKENLTPHYHETVRV